MTYRYPFTPFPRGWYRINTNANKLFAFDRELILKIRNGKFILHEINQENHPFPVVQKNNHTFAYFDIEKRPPSFTIPFVSEFNEQNWQKPFHLCWNKTRVHIQEIAENALDLSHFCTVHHYKTIPVLSRFAIKNHQFNVIMYSSRKLLGRLTKTTMDITYHGLGITVANVTTSHNVTLKVLLMTTPITRELVDIHMDVAIKKTKNPLMNWLLRLVLPHEIKTEFSRDIPVWEAKIYRNSPVACHYDGNIIRIRKWARQFYDETN